MAITSLLGNAVANAAKMAQKKKQQANQNVVLNETLEALKKTQTPQYMAAQRQREAELKKAQQNLQALQQHKTNETIAKNKASGKTSSSGGAVPASVLQALAKATTLGSTALKKPATQQKTQNAIAQGVLNGVNKAVSATNIPQKNQTSQAPTMSGYASYKGSTPTKASPSDNMAYLQNVAQNMPQSLSEYTSKYTDQINALVDKITNREAFSYDLNADPLYEMYKNQYTQLGNSAMKDTIAEASALTGGYGNSYATTAGNQAYQSYLNQLNAVVPELYETAYGKYQDEGNDLLQKLAMYQELDSGDYAKFLDAYDMEIQRQQMARDQLESDRNYNLALEEFNRKNYESDRDYNMALQELAQSQKSSGSSARAEVVNDYYKEMRGLLDAETADGNNFRYSVQKVADNIVSAYENGLLTEDEANELYFRLGISDDDISTVEMPDGKTYTANQIKAGMNQQTQAMNLLKKVLGI